VKPYLRITHSLVLSISMIVLSACSSDSPNLPPIDTSLSLREQLQIIVDDAVESGIPGVSLHVQDGDESISVVAGVVNRDTAEPVMSSSLFQAGSIGKAHVATALVRLVDMGFLQLEDPIDLWLDPSLSSMIADSDIITVEMLLAHSSGIQDYFNNPEFVDDFLATPGKSYMPIELLAYIDNAENNFEPGADYRYSNTNYVLAGVIAERVTGVSIDMVLRQWIFEPAGLANTFANFQNPSRSEIARGYIPISYVENVGLNADLPVVESDYDTSALLLSDELGDAPIHATAEDLNSFVRTLIDTDTLVSSELKSRMLVESFPGFSKYGLGLEMTADGSTFGHSGGGVGLLSQMFYTPSEDRSFATIANASFGNYSELFSQYLIRLSSLGFRSPSLN